MSTLLNTGTISTAQSPVTTAVQYAQGNLANNLVLYANFAYGTGGTSVDAYVQTSFDGGTSWVDIANFHFTTSAAKRMYNLSRQTAVTSIATPSDGSMSNNTSLDGFIGSQFRVKWTSSGTYGGATSLIISIAPGGGRIA